MSKLSEFLEEKKIDPRRILIASRQLESLRPEDRRVRFAKTRVRKGSATDAEKELAQGTARSGRPVTSPTLQAALRGDRLSTKTKRRITSAVNHVMAQKKKDTVEPSALFG